MGNVSNKKDISNNALSFWDNVFSKQKPKENIETIKIHSDLEKAISWLSQESKSVLDYGCGSGTMLLKCACYEDVHKCLGIDISPQAVDLGSRTAILNNLANKIEFTCGDIHELEKISENSFEAAILSNIIDNVTPADTMNIIKNINKIIIPNGKILIKLNPHLSKEQIDEAGLKLIENDLYIEEEGIYLRNLTTTQWENMFKQYFIVNEYKDVYFQEFNQYNRLFILINNK